LLRRILVPLLWIAILFLVLGSLFSRDAGLPTRLSERYLAGDLTAPKLAVVEVEGLLMDEVAEHALKQIRQARDDDQVRAVVLRIDSPGGTVSAADRVWREVESLKRDGRKPVVVSMGGMAASGGYYIAAPADSIFAEPTTLTGSIGVILEIPQLNGLLQKLGVEFETITTGEWKDTGSMYRPMTQRERKRWKEVIDEPYQRFLRVVAQGRGLSIDELKPVANGKVYTSREALQHKLINAIGYLDDAILQAQRLAKLESAHVIRYAKSSGLTEALLSLTTQRNALPISAETPLRLQTPRLLFLAR
jgi:protease-4